MPRLKSNEAQRSVVLKTLQATPDEKMSKERIRALTGISERMIRHCISDLGKLGFPVGSESKSEGYEYTVFPEKIRRWIDELKSRRREISSRKDGLEKAHEKALHNKPQAALFGN